MFFFEKKNQKTFAIGQPCCGRFVGSWGRRKSKSFLLLFFKKEGLSYAPARLRHVPSGVSSAA
jgi:hypothetical protein